jgi:hypothetical protein
MTPEASAQMQPPIDELFPSQSKSDSVPLPFDPLNWKM